MRVKNADALRTILQKEKNAIYFACFGGGLENSNLIVRDIDVYRYKKNKILSYFSFLFPIGMIVNTFVQCGYFFIIMFLSDRDITKCSTEKPFNVYDKPIDKLSTNR